MCSLTLGCSLPRLGTGAVAGLVEGQTSAKAAVVHLCKQHWENLYLSNPAAHHDISSHPADDQLQTGPKLELASALEGAHKAQRKAIININRGLFWLCLLPICVWCEVVGLQLTAGTCMHDTNKAEGDAVILHWK